MFKVWNKRRALVFLLDVAFVLIARILAYLLRFDFNIPLIFENRHVPYTLGLVLLIKPAVFLLSNLYRNLWRYTSLYDALAIFKAVSYASVLYLVAMIFTGRFENFSRSVFLLDWLILFCLMTASRLCWRFYRERYILSIKASGQRTLIVGAGEAGSLLVKEMWKQKEATYNVVGFVDDDPLKRGMRLHGLPVLGETGHLGELVAKHNIEKVVIAMPSAGKGKIREIVRSCEYAKVRFQTLPGISDLIDGSVSVSHVKDVEIEDLLGRDPVVLDDRGIGDYLTDKNVLVTGAAGSIGSELCRQIARFKPYKLILFDSAETPLFFIERELAATFPEQRLITVMGDIRNSDKLEWLFAEFKPEVVFHAAAYKHVPMMEHNPAEAVTNNVLGTRVLADTASRYGVKNFVMVSTDKAVNPTNVMGATKRAAERYVQALAVRSATKFTTVRFGNVLGSNGSVIPIFKEQIRNGGPVKVTDPNVIRYFMTIPEASQLVLQAGCLGDSGEIFVLDMGEPVRIVELAEELIRLSGLAPYEDIDIVFTGLRPGEKLFEELLVDGEGIKPTPHEKIKVLAAMQTENFGALSAELDQLLEMAVRTDVKELMESLKRIVPEFTPQYLFNGTPPYAFKRVRPDLFPQMPGKVVALNEQSGPRRSARR